MVPGWSVYDSSIPECFVQRIFCNRDDLSSGQNFQGLTIQGLIVMETVKTVVQKLTEF